MSTTAVAPSSRDKPRAATVLAISAILIAGLVVAVSALGTSLLGVPTSYVNGVDSRLGAQVARDFLADQDAEATALSNGDPSAINGRLTGNALVDVSHQISDQSASRLTSTVSFQPASLIITRAQDPVDPSLVIEVQEDGTKTVITSGGPNSAPTEQSIGFHGNFWVRTDASGRYLIADQSIQNHAPSIQPAVAVVVAALVAVGLAFLIRQRSLRSRLQPAARGQSMPAPERIEIPGDEEPVLEPPQSPPEIMVTTFGGLHVNQGTTDWAQALMSRPVTGFVWLRLLVAAIRDPAARVSRDELARQTSPGLSRDVQLKRLRNVVAKGLPDLPAPLRDRILVEPEVMSFRLDGCAIDAIELLAVSAECSGTNRISSPQASRVGRVLQACQGTFLPEFEAIEDLATDRHPTSAGLVRELRELLINKRVDLSLLLADGHIRAGRPVPAIAALEPALADRGERKDIAARLAAAYRAAGRDAEARALEAHYA